MTKMNIIMIMLAVLLACGTVSAAGESIIFLHHSTGLALIDEGSVREGLTSLGYNFYDHGYNEEGLRNADGDWTGTNFNVPGDNTDPDGYAEIFSQGVHSPPDNTLSHLLTYDVIAFKSCFPTSVISDAHMLASYKEYYLTIRETIDEQPDKLFVLLTMPPEVPANTDPAAAKRARDFTQWLKSDEYLGDRGNVVVFDLFNYLADGSNVLKSTYRQDEYDAHPNPLANREIGPVFVRFLDNAIKEADLAGAPAERAEPEYAEEIVEEPDYEETAEDPEYEAPAEAPRPTTTQTGKLIDGFEGGFAWEAYSDGSVTEISCAASNRAHAGDTGMIIEYDVMNGGYADCGKNFDAADWSSYDGVEMWLNTDNMGQYFNFVIFSVYEGENVPYQTEIMTTETMTRGWSKVFLPWNMFKKADWAAGPDSPDLRSMQGVNFNFEARGADQTGTIYVDDIQLGMEFELVVETPPRTDYQKRTDDLTVADKNLDDDSGMIVLYVGLGILLIAAILALVWWLVRRK
ncbi:CIA30 family protein [Candidatus Woesearchaeota archaeon]|nr:CIA30 family protein [Candidatus Woesearchaeota archaeon]